MEEYIREIARRYSRGTVTCVIQNVPIGLEPVFDKLHAELGKAMLSINAVKGFEYGSDFAQMKGSEHNDLHNSDGTTKRIFRRYSGGISNGMDIFSVLLLNR
jgi:chorismate synthase